MLALNRWIFGIRRATPAATMTASLSTCAAALLVLLRAPGPAMAAPASNGMPMVTLDEALSYAEQHQPQIRSALAEFAARNAESRIPRAKWMPRIGATTQIFFGSNNDSSAVSLGVPEVDVPRTGATGGRTTSSANWSPSASTIAAISINQEVYDFGRIAAQSSVADALARVAHASAEAATLDVQLGVEEAFHGVLAAKQVLQATEAAYVRAETHRDFARAGTKSGLRPPIDLTRAEADLAQLGVRRIRARSGLEIARAGLAASMGSEAREVDAEELSSALDAAPAFDEVLRAASQKNPFIVAALARLDAQHSTTRAITRELLPNLFASMGLSGRAGGFAPASGTTTLPYGDGWLPDVGNWHVGLVLTWTVFDGTVLARRSASLAREEAVRADVESARLAVTLGSERAYLDLDAALKAVPGLTEAVAAARANQAQADARYRAGLGNVVELADAEGLLTNSELDLAIGKFAVARARAALGRVMADAASPTKAVPRGARP